MRLTSFLFSILLGPTVAHAEVTEPTYFTCGEKNGMQAGISYGRYPHIIVTRYHRLLRQRRLIFTGKDGTISPDYSLSRQHNLFQDQLGTTTLVLYWKNVKPTEPMVLFADVQVACRQSPNCPQTFSGSGQRLRCYLNSKINYSK